ncbi:MAG: recombinase family protein [Eubacteriales bacterium]
MSKYKIGIYLRISVKDKEQADESNSIKVQGEIINKFIEQTRDLKDSSVTIYCDDGYSGTNFNRPQVNQLLDDIRDGHVNCVIVKDISRFGRNYIEVGNFLEKIFPFMGVRFISISDDYDSIRPNDVGGLMSAFRSIFAEVYSQELSGKVRVALEHYIKNGIGIVGPGPYGYYKKAGDKTKLYIDEPAAEIVRLIFDKYLAGDNLTQIAVYLNSNGIPSPRVYDMLNGKYDGKYVGQKYVWRAERIRSILQDENYIGNFCYGKTRKERVNVKYCKRTPKDEWIIMQDSHEAIISKENFERVAAKLKLRGSRETKCRLSEHYVAPPRVNIIAKLLRCGICDHKMYYHPKRNNSYVDCRIGRLDKNYACHNTRIELEKIRAVLVEVVEKHIDTIVNKKTVLNHTSNKVKLKNLFIKKEKLSRDNDKWVKRLKELFQNHFDKIIDDAVFEQQHCVIVTERNKTELALEDVNKKIKILEEQIKFEKSFMLNYENITDVTEITDELLVELIEEVIVYDNDTLEVKWKFKEE